MTQNTPPRYEPFGWHHWPDHFFMSYQFRRGLGETQEGGGSVSECFQAASKMIPGDLESWHTEWMHVANRNLQRGDDAHQRGHIRSAMNAWLRAVDYYRSAEFWLEHDDPRRLATLPYVSKLLRSGCNTCLVKLLKSLMKMVKLCRHILLSHQWVERSNLF